MINNEGDKMICSYCNKGLKPFKTINDWNKRKLHKTCWKKQQDILYIKSIIEKHKKPA